jgi:hypothetical protein
MLCSAPLLQPGSQRSPTPALTSGPRSGPTGAAPVLPLDYLKENGNSAWPRRMETIPLTRPKTRSLAVVTACRYNTPEPPSVDSHRPVRARRFRASRVEHHQRAWNCITENPTDQENRDRRTTLGGTRREGPPEEVAGTMASGARWRGCPRRPSTRNEVPEAGPRGRQRRRRLPPPRRG